MTIDQAIEKLRYERTCQLSSRFPCRAIMVQNIARYCELLDKLHKIPQVELVPAEELFPEPDIMPRYANLTKPQFASKWVILTGVSEYLRLFSRHEAESHRFSQIWRYQAPANSIGRIIIPLWGCEAQWFDSSIHLMDDIRLKEYYFNCIDTEDSEQNLEITVLSDVFRQQKELLAIQDIRVLDGLQAWYEYWSTPVVNETRQLLITGRTNSLQSINGRISVRIIRDELSFIQVNLRNGQFLSSENCPPEAQRILLKSIGQKNTVEDAILYCLNVGQFTALDVMGRWSVLSAGQKHLLKLWYQLNQDDSYLCHCILSSDNPNEIENHILHDFFTLGETHPSWIAESQQLIAAMKLEKDDEYYTALERIPEYSDRLNYLSGDTMREKSYLLLMVGKWLRIDNKQVYSSKKLKEIYPALFAYLDETPYDERLKRYMTLYKSYKLSNTLPEDEQLYFSDIQIESYDFRYPLLDKALDDQTVILWIDALGVEWLPLLLWSLNKRNDGKVLSAEIGLANLPTETEYNKQWEQMDTPYRKLDRLDKLAHTGVIDDPSYYSCINEQIEFVSSIESKIGSLLKEYHRIIITGDHGTSRLAARFFHKREGLPVPKGGKAMSHGRFGLVSSEPPFLPPTQVSIKDTIGNHYIVFYNYDHFVQSGFAAGANDDNAIYGEVHGGATPEESLVPVIVFESNKALPIKANWKQNPVKISARRVKASLCFSQPIQTLQASIGAINAYTSQTPGTREWMLEFSGVPAGLHQVSVVANGTIIPIDPLRVNSALGNSEGDLF